MTAALRPEEVHTVKQLLEIAKSANEAMLLRALTYGCGLVVGSIYHSAPAYERKTVERWFIHGFGDASRKESNNDD